MVGLSLLENSMKDYTASLKDGRAIFIPSWPVDVALENLAQASKCLGTESVINISKLCIPTVIVAIMQSEDPKLTSALIKHFICQVRIDGQKISPETINKMFEGDLAVVTELFAHVIHSQYSDFFVLGLVKETSPEKQSQEKLLSSP